MARAIACARNSKCGVSPRTRHPSGTIASKRPVSASNAIAAGNSNDPATSKISTDAPFAVARSRAARSTPRVTSSFHLARTTATRMTRRSRLVADEVEEPELSESCAGVLEGMRAGQFGRTGSAWHDYQNALEQLHRSFAQHDDQFLPSVALLLWVALGVLASIVVSVSVNLAQIHAIPPGTFSVWHRITLIDPRALAAAFAASSLFTTVVLHVGFGDGAFVWMRGAARGWHERVSAPLAFVTRYVARALLARSSAAVVLLIALLTFWPNIAATQPVGARGGRNVVALPL